MDIDVVASSSYEAAPAVQLLAKARFGGVRLRGHRDWYLPQEPSRRTQSSQADETERPERLVIWFLPRTRILDLPLLRERLASDAVIVVCATDLDRRTLATWLAHGARSVLSVAELPTRLIPAIRAVASGGGFLAVADLALLAGALEPNVSALRESLTPREQETLYFIANGFTHQQAARRMGVSVTTVNTYLRRMRSKLGPGNKATLARIATDLDLLDHHPDSSRRDDWAS